MPNFRFLFFKVISKVISFGTLTWFCIHAQILVLVVVDNIHKYIDSYIHTFMVGCDNATFPLAPRIFCGRQGRLTTSSESDSDESDIAGWGFTMGVWGLVTVLWGDLRAVCLGFLFGFRRLWLMMVLMLIWASLVFFPSVSDDSLYNLFDPFLIGGVGGVGYRSVAMPLSSFPTLLSVVTPLSSMSHKVNVGVWQRHCPRHDIAIPYSKAIN